MAMNLFLWGEETRSMTLRQRVIGLLILFMTAGILVTATGLIALLTAILSNQALITSLTPDYIRKLWMIASAWTVADWLDIYVASFCTGYRVAMRESYGSLWIVPCKPLHSLYLLEHTESIALPDNVLGLAKAFFPPSWLGGSAKGYTSSGSIADTIKEPNAFERAPLFRRLRYSLWDKSNGLHLVYIILMILGVLRRIP